MNKTLTLLFCFLTTFSLAQEAMEVLRCADIDRRVPIRNIYIDDNNNKWVADEQGLFLAQSPDFAKEVGIEDSQWSVLSVADGNEELNLPKSELQGIMGDQFSAISCAAFDKVKKELYIGTKGGGIFHFKTNPSLSLINKMTSKNSKLRSDNITTLMYLTSKNQLIAGTDDGLFISQGRKSKLAGKYFNILAVTYYMGTIWVLGDNEVMELDDKNDLYGLEMQTQMVEGSLVDIAFDSQGRLWIASEIICRYNFELDSYEIFGPAENFTSQFVNYIAVDSDDALWVGTDDKGVYFIGRASSMSASLVVDKPLGCDANSQDASLQVRASGGQPPYTYEWSAALQGDNPSNLGPGDYSVTVTDKNGKTVQAEAKIEDPRLTLKISQEKEASVGGGEDGSATVSVSGGNPKYRYQWDNGETTETANRLAPGEHSVTVSDANGCSTTAKVTITEMLAEFNVALEQTAAINCQGGATAALQAKASGGQGPYTFKWSAAGQSGESIGGLAKGNYQITATDALGNTANAALEIAEPTAVKATITPQAPASTNNQDGKALAKAEGGTGPYTYKWDSGESTAEAAKLGAGKHTVTVTDKNGCTASANIEVTEDILPLVVELKSNSEIKCAGGNGGALAAEVSGGKSPFQYQWSNGNAVGQSAIGLSAGAYSLTVTDAAGTTTEASFTVEEPRALSASITPKSPASTNNSDGKATVKAEGGSGKYTYKWDSGETEDMAKKLAAGSHSVTVTDANGCSTTATTEVTEDILPLVVELKNSGEIKCSGGTGGALTAEVSGGKSPFQYAWSSGGSSGESASGLSAGAYSLTVTDAAGTTTEASFTVEEPKALSASITPKSPASTNNSDGKATVKAEGGSGKYTYKWDSGETEDMAKKLAAGSHSVTVTDANGCSATATTEVTEDILPLVVELKNSGAIKCTGGTGGALTAEISGGKSPFQYAWSSGGSSGESASGLSAGAYSLTVTDAAGTTTEASFTVEEPKAISASITPKSPASTNNSDGKATVKAEGGSGKYTYKWDSGETEGTAKKLAAGSHSVTVTDANGCSTTATTEVTEDILPLVVELKSSGAIKCTGGSGGALTAEVSGGKSPFQYAWSSGGSSGESASGLSAGAYSLTVTDAAGTTTEASFTVEEPKAISASITPKSPASTNNSDGKATVKAEGGSGQYTYKWDSGETEGTAKKLAAGSHSVTVTDANGCSTTATTEVTEDILPLVVELKSSGAIKCTGGAGGALTAEVSGGKSPFQYAWSSGGSSGESANSLSAGAYSLTVTDAAGTSTEARFTIEEPQALTAKITPVAPASTNNSDGKAKVKASGGSGDYTYKWDNGETSLSAEKLAPGQHQVTITDANGCTTEAAIEITEDILPLAVAIEQTAEIACNGERSAALNVEVSGGKSPFTYSWGSDNLNGTNPGGLVAGSYKVTVSDTNGSTKEAGITIEQPAALSVAIGKSNPTTNENSKDGMISLTVEGGTSPYTYQWDNGESAAKAKELSFGAHSVTVTDAKGCKQSLDFEMDKKILPALTAGRLRKGQTLQVSQIYFEADSTNMTEESFPVMNEIAEFLKQNPLIVVEVGGHTNDVPETEFCDRLSTARAKSVATYIVEQGVDGNRVVYKGYGKRKPKFSNRTAEGRRKNQRVEMKILRLQ
ncbi:MAG: OmpA family protein [Bacteroidota bacterium]